MKKLLFLIFALFMTCVRTFSQVGIGTTTPSTNSVLDLYGTDKGLIVPRVTNANRPANTQGMLLYQTDGTSGLYLNSGSAYSRIISGTGSSGYVPKFNSSGDLQNSQLYDNGTNIGIGTTNPLYKIDLGTGAINAPGGFYENGVKLTGSNTWTESGNNIYNSNTGYVGIGSSAPAARLDVYQNMTSHPVPTALRVNSLWNPTTVTGMYNAFGMVVNTEGTLANAQGGNPGTFYSLYTKHTISGAAASNMVCNTVGDYFYTTFESNGQAVTQRGAYVVSYLDNANGNIISNFGLDVITGNLNVSANPGNDKGVINNNYGIIIRRPNVTGTIYNNYGLYIANQATAGQTLTYPIFYNTPSGGDAYLSAGGVWTNGCDSTGKENIIRANSSEILDKIMQLPVSFWNYKCEKPGYRHISPMAQDFQSIFNVGYQDNTISTIDPPGVALAGIQELVKRNGALMKTVESQAKDIESLKQENAMILSRLQELENRSGK
jgi:hypothetical protein